MKKGFTIVELLMVVGIIALLLGIVTTAASQSIKAGRERQASALCAIVQSALATYHAQNDKWPDPLANKVKNGSFGGSNNEGTNNQDDADKYVLTASEVRAMVKALVEETKKGNPVMDVSALFVSRFPGEKGEKGFGLDFMSAVRGTPKSKKKMTTGEMYFGYPDKETGRFRRFKMVYSIPTDQLTVSRQ
jgi:prepilin-type N-terminal cleavage/methylation domain-containing protein